MIALQGASRWYGQVIGLNDVTCEIKPGVTALLGVNGSGKSTLMRLVTGQIKPSTGEIKVFGESPFANPNVYKRLGYCPEIDDFYEHRSGRQFVELMGRLHGYNAKESRDRTDKVLHQVGMAERADRQIKGYSKGMRQRIKLAQAMLHDPDIILLDEPLNGLDPVGRREYIDLLEAYAAQGKAVIVSSHILFEVEQMTRSILLLHRGRLLAAGDLTVIRELIDKHPHRVRIETPQPREVARHLVALPYVLDVQFDARGDGLEIRTREPGLFFDMLPSLVLDEGLRIDSYGSPDNNLESVFRYLVES
ncbi:ABC transporter ATP-binding protein [bacterium]|nr:MAG: ABC transporter ATP-binding protein [bacterium]